MAADEICLFYMSWEYENLKILTCIYRLTRIKVMQHCWDLNNNYSKHIWILTNELMKYVDLVSRTKLLKLDDSEIHSGFSGSESRTSFLSQTSLYPVANSLFLIRFSFNKESSSARQFLETGIHSHSIKHRNTYLSVKSGRRPLAVGLEWVTVHAHSQELGKNRRENYCAEWGRVRVFKIQKQDKWKQNAKVQKNEASISFEWYPPIMLNPKTTSLPVFTKSKFSFPKPWKMKYAKGKKKKNSKQLPHHDLKTPALTRAVNNFLDAEICH